MSASRGIRYQVGVVGLGRLWEARHKPALARLQDRFKVVAVYDQVARRAALEAKNLNCAACLGLVELMERPDVDLIYLLTPQWFGLHAAELAALKGKPIYCGLPIASDPSGFEALATIVKDRKVPFMLELARRFYPVTLRLRELLATTLGEPKLVLGQSRLFGFDRYGQPGPTTQNAPVSLLVDPGSYLVDWCRFVFQSDPVRLQGFGALGLPSQGQNPSPTPPGDFASLHLEFPMGKTAQIEVTRYDAKSWGDATRFLPVPGFQVYAENGVALLEMPDRIQWSDSRGTHEERLPLEPTVGEMLNDQFHRMVRGDHSLAPNIEEALALARQIAILHQSGDERRLMDCQAAPAE